VNVHNTSESKKPSEVGTQTSTGLTIPPLNLYRMVYCQSCPEAEFCKVSFEQHLLCLLAKLAADRARTRQVITSANSHRV